jgi:hypothetical protein
MNNLKHCEEGGSDVNIEELMLLMTDLLNDLVD